MQKVYQSIDNLIVYAQKYLMLDERDVLYTKNSIFRLLGLESYAGTTQQTQCTATSPDVLLNDFVAACVEENLFASEESEYYCDEVMGELMMSPSLVNCLFEQIEGAKGGKAATDWFYDYSVKSDYVKKSKLDKNPRFEANGLVITINKAKPEFADPKKAQSGNATKGGYPKCSICRENEGFAGRNKRTLRTVNLTLGGQKWFWQYSPYGYFKEHGIAVNCEHIPMHVDRGAFGRLMDFVDEFPHYFIGCNAALPRIGGSVLAHDHYQGGGEILPMHKAKAAVTLKNKQYPDAVVEVVDWPGTVIRIVSANRATITEIADAVRVKWENYSNPALGIVPFDGEGVHSAVSPTVVKTHRGYEMSLILRNNITTERYPDGVFHAHPEYHMIKKESIGLIEAQGLFILPGRLEAQLSEIEKCIAEHQPLKEELQAFGLVYDEVKAMGGDVHVAMQRELGSICGRILENTAVFKDRNLTVEFLKDLGFTK
jgi:UDPglucose--hexose-1-phosphate uridylyltransferase